jgi:hypothetical protein
MKRSLLSLFALTLSFAFACGPQPGGNSKPVANANRAEGIAADGAALIPVVITLGSKPKDDASYYLSIAPYEVTLSKAGKDQIQWILSNPLKDLELRDVKINNFKSGANTDPFGNGGKFDFPYLQSQAATQQRSGPGVNYGAYDYEVSGTLVFKTGATKPLTMDPRVIISQ